MNWDIPGVYFAHNMQTTVERQSKTGFINVFYLGIVYDLGQFTLLTQNQKKREKRKK